MAEKTRSPIAKIIGGIVGFVVGYAVVYLIIGGLLGGNSDEKRLKLLQAESEAFNKSCPVQIDEYTEVKTMTILPPRTIRYWYIVTLPEGYDVETAKANLEPYTKQWVKTQPDMRQLRELDVIFRTITARRTVRISSISR